MPQSWYSITASAGVAEIHIYEEIGYWGVNAKQFADDLKGLRGISTIQLRINSPGGSVFDGTAIYNCLKQHPATVVAYIDGLAASMASVIAMAADRIVMPENALMMIHNPWTVSYGDAEQLRKDADLLDKVKASLISAYRRSGKSDDEIAALMDAETWFTGEEAVAAGFADEVEAAIPLAASAGFGLLDQFNKTPQALNPKSPKIAPVGAAKQPPKEATMPKETIPAPQAPEAHLDAEAIRAAAIRDEEDRRTEISAVFAAFPAQSELLMKCLLDSKCSADDARGRLLKRLGEGETPVAGVQVLEDMPKARRAAMSDVLAMRAGHGPKVGDNNPYRGSTLLDMARASLESQGFQVYGLDKLGIVAAAFTHSSSDFGHLLSGLSGKSMLKGYAEADEVFDRFTSKGNLPDFKALTRVDLNEFPSLRQVREGAEFKYVTIGDRGETVQLATYGERFSITRQAIINDDLDAFTRIPAKFGRAARRTVGDLVFAILTGNQVMSDGKALFHNDHGNLLSSSGLDAAKYGAGRVAMGKQKDPSGHAVLNIRPAILLCPMALEDTANVLRTSETDPSKTNSRVPNPVRNAFEVISDARLDEANPAHWYQLASALSHDVIEVQYLDGNDSPLLEQQQGWGVDGTEFKVRIDVGAKALDWRTMVKHT